MQQDLHEGHRDRLLKKFNEYPDSFSDHELLELFLFPVIPRKDTNATAHRLLQSFGNIKRVFSATAEQLMMVQGVGKAVAAQIVLSAKLMRKISEFSSKAKDERFVSAEKTREYVKSLFKGVKTEKMYFILLNDAFEMVFSKDYSNNNEEFVKTDTADLSKAIIEYKAKYVIMAHNHPSGNANPSDADDLATKKVCMTCNLHGVSLVDHIIVTNNTTFSYFADGHLSFIKEKAEIQ